jgi:hypothetical protein
LRYRIADFSEIARKIFGFCEFFGKRENPRGDFLGGFLMLLDSAINLYRLN